MDKFPNITGLRFFLAILVIIFHLAEFCSKHEIPFYNQLPIFHKGFESVCMFFSLSGFLIIRQLHIEKSITNTISLKNFFLRRSLRIFPLYFLILFFGLTYYNYILQKFGFVAGYNKNYDLIEGLLLSIFFMPNVFANLYSPGGIIEALWCIGVEEQFYLFIAPILLIISLKKHLYFLGFFTITFFLLFFYVEGNIFSKYGMLFFYFTSSGLLSLLLLKKQFCLKNEVMIVITLILFGLYFTTDVFSNFLSDAYFHLVSMILFSAVIGILSIKPFIILNNKTITFLGKISYGIYMYHSVVIQFMGLLYLKIFSKLGISSYLIVIFYNIFCNINNNYYVTSFISIF